ncbi:hypothetical protein [Streptomyces sp. NPDC060243]|uniref:hypothetical protein n=1 Tax=Streptomyces sp. NPDC060243 TaxID=3347081 RepID=UPI0036684D17
MDWHKNKREASPAEVARAEGTVARVRLEVAEIRAAAEQLSALSPFEKEVADFLTAQALILEREVSQLYLAATMRPESDTLEQAGMLPTAARSALLIARAYLARK